MSDWTTIADPEHGIGLRVPTAAISGAVVEVTVDQDAIGHRIHAQTADGSEVYVEVLSYAAIVDHAEAAAEQRSGLRDRSPEAHISEASASVMLDRPATTFDFSGLLGGLPRVRRFILVDAAGRTVRIVLDPTSATNQAIVDTLEFA